MLILTGLYFCIKGNTFALLSFFRNFGCAEVTITQQCNIKIIFSFALLSFFRNFATDVAKLLTLGIKRIKFFVLRSFFRNFARKWTF